uniref:Uncharacterized protein n=1 Tax=Trepomonas sp. PC1 TaxID=1076344 RepID=A0A146KJF1_9EUKA|eukprot:JAP96288.1 hypothetical protein TPC1_10428 [Trepomonas sp. PC1]
MAEFSFSSEDDAPKQDWELAAEKENEKLIQAQKEEQEKLEQEKELERQEQLKHRERENKERIEVELDEEARQRLNRKKREEQNQKLANNFLKQSSDEEDSDQQKTQKKSIKRNYDLEDEFFATNTKKQTQNEENELPQTQSQFEKYADNIAQQITKTHVRGGGKDNDVMYLQMLKRIVKAALKPLYVEDAKEMSDFCAQIANEQIKTQKKVMKGTAQKAKNKKPTINTHKGDDLDEDFL